MNCQQIRGSSPFRHHMKSQVYPSMALESRMERQLDPSMERMELASKVESLHYPRMELGTQPSPRRGAQHAHGGVPVGLKFLPTNEELVINYLAYKVLHKPFPSPTFQDMEVSMLYSKPPNQVVSFAHGEREWFFFVHNNKDKGNVRIIDNREGFWKSSGEEYPIYGFNRNVCAFKAIFTYFRGSDPRRAKKTHWTMEEFSLSSNYQEVFRNSRKKKLSCTDG